MPWTPDIADAPREGMSNVPTGAENVTAVHPPAWLFMNRLRLIVQTTATKTYVRLDERRSFVSAKELRLTRKKPELIGHRCLPPKFCVFAIVTQAAQTSLDFGLSEPNLHREQIASSLIDDRRVRRSERMPVRSLVRATFPPFA